MPRKPVMAVAMSGGVDSSVAAWMVKKISPQVFGVFMRLGNLGEEQAERAARAVCRRLSIELRAINLADQFAVQVKKYYAQSYGQGMTPNPCVVCNRLVKFGDLLRQALVAGADYLATGHYVRRLESKNSNRHSPVFELWKGLDQNKDQSYFLWGLAQKQIRKILFPLGALRKPTVRRLARQASLPSLSKESHDVCFLSQDRSHISYLKASLKFSPGPIKTAAGAIIGQHAGLPLYTIGQRQGIAVGGSGPYYVYGKDRAENALLVAGPESPALFLKKSFAVASLNWISGAPPRLPLPVDIVFRYRQPGVKGIVKNFSQAGQNKSALIELSIPQRAITPGQSAVFYQGSQMLGGGIILENF